MVRKFLIGRGWGKEGKLVIDRYFNYIDRDQGPNSKKQCILRGEYDFNDPAWKHISDEGNL